MKLREATFDGSQIAVRFQYEWKDHEANWYRAYGNENWQFDEDGLINVKNRIALKDALPGDSSSIGLANIEERYKVFSDIPVEIQNDGDYFIVKIPLLKFK